MIWGVDPASKKIAMFTDNDGLIHRELIEVQKSDRNLELMSLRNHMEYVIKYDRDPIIYCEEPVVAGARNLRSTILVAETVGMILCLNAQVYLVPVSSWKKYTVGKGNATKDDVAAWLEEEHPDYARECRDTKQRPNQDLRDAAAIYLYGKEMEALRGRVLPTASDRGDR
jgi:Holliday junction resolvasome RuvABC endonuclease subunit